MTNDLTERQIQHQILDYLRKKGILAWMDRQVVGKPGIGTFRSSSGVSDILGVLPGGRFMAVEVKRKKGVVSPQQLQFLSEVERKGGLAVIARCVEDVMSVLKDNS